MRYLGPEGLAALKDLIKKALDGKANKTHTHEKSEIGDYVDYELPVASDETLGGVKIGEGLEIDEDGVLNTAIKELEWDKVQNKPTKVSEFENDVGYINGIPENYVTKEYLESLELVSEIPEEYITEKELAEKGFLTEVPSFYITDNELKEKGYITHYTETDPVFQGSPSFKITDDDIANWNKIANEYNIPTKVSELENDREFIAKTDTNSSVWGRLHVYDRYNNWGDNIDLATGRIQGVNWGGSADTLYLNQNSNENVEILSNGKGKLYYKRKEVATQEYVDEQIANIEFDGENIDLTDYAKKEYVDEQISNIEVSGGYSLPIASTDTLGGIKVGANLTIDEDGTLNATASSTGDGSVMVDTVPIGTVILYDGEEIPDGYEEVENYIPTYSTEEQVIGTWINGKPLYRKVLSLLSPNSKAVQNIDTGVTGIERFIKIDASIDTGLGSNGVIFANYHVSSGSSFYVRGYGDKVQSFTGESAMLQKDMVIIIEYTKTTD